MAYPENVQPFSDGYEQVALQTVVGQIRQPRINNGFLEDLHYWETDESKSYDGESVYLTRPSISGYIQAVGTPEVAIDELFVPYQIAESFELEDFQSYEFLIATADHASQLERFFI